MNKMISKHIVYYILSRFGMLKNKYILAIDSHYRINVL